MSANDSTDFEDERERTLYVSNIHDDVTEDLLYELFVQAGPLNNVSLKKSPRGCIAFVEFKHEESIPYVIDLMNNICLFNRPLNLKARDGTRMSQKLADAQRDAARSEREAYFKREMEERERSRVAWQQHQQQSMSPWIVNNGQPVPYQQAHHVNYEYMVQQHQFYMSQHQQHPNSGQPRPFAASLPNFQRSGAYGTPPPPPYQDTVQQKAYSRDNRQQQQYDDRRTRDYEDHRHGQPRSAERDRRRSRPY